MSTVKLDIGHIYPACGHNLGGLNHLRIIPVENVVSIPAARQHIIQGEAQLVDPDNYLDIFFASDTGSFKETTVETEHGEYCKQNMKVYIPKDAPDVGYWANTLTGIRCIALYRDNNDYVKLVGSKESPLTFLPELDTDDSTAGKNGHVFSFAGVSLEKAYFYQMFEVTPPGTRKRFSMGFNFGFRRH